MTGYIYPNEAEVWWSILIVLYPYITGLVAGAFIVSALYHVFQKTALKPVAKLALLSALALLIVAPLPLLLHLGHPFRALNIMFTPHPTSAMAGFGYIYSIYFIIVLLEIWFVFRKDIVTYAQNSSGFKRWGYRLLSLGADDLSDAAIATDKRIATILATIGIPAAVFLHGYVGFIFGAIKANPWWSTVLMPVIFLISAIVSGTALLMLIYAASSKLRHEAIDSSCLMALNRYLWSFLVIDVTLEFLEILHKGYEARDEWGAIYGLLTQQISFSFFWIQLFLGAFIPLVLLLVARSRKFSHRLQNSLTLASAAFILIGVFAMRYNVVIGGQLISKSLMGYTHYQTLLVGKDSLITVLALLILPLGLLAVIVRVLPPWLPKEK